MLKNSSTKKVHKQFWDFTEEEQWLQNMLQYGWLLYEYSYEDEDGCTYMFKQIKNREEKNIIYKIDYQDFNKKDDYLEYEEIFRADGWTILSKNKWYSKHIFYTSSQNSNLDIFSDSASYIEREKGVMRSSLINVFISFVFLIISITLYNMFEKTIFIGGALFTIFSITKFTISYLKHRNKLKSLLQKQLI